MSYNGSGTFTINTTGQPVVAGTIITASAFNSLTTDLATGLTTAITKDGQTTTTARITFAQGLTSSLVTDSSSISTGSIITGGGVGIAKALFVGTTANVAGAVTLGGIATFSAQPIFSSLTASSAVATDASKGLVSVTNTGTGNNVLATSPTITTPVISSIVNTGTLTLPTSTDTLVGRATTDTLTNKTLTGAVMNGTLGATTPSTVAATTISASSTATFAAGAVGTPSITTSGDTNTGIFFPAADTIAFSEGGAESMRINSSGNVGIGTTSQNEKLVVNGAIRSTNNAAGATATADSGVFYFVPTADAPSDPRTILQGVGTAGVGASIAFFTGTSASNSERMRIDSSGKLLLNQTAVVLTGVIQFTFDGQNEQGMCIKNSANSTNGAALRFIDYTNAYTGGGIYFSSSNSINYATSSDYRLKENIAPMTGALTKIQQLKPVTFSWKQDNSVSQGFIAHELQAVIPEAVNGTKDAVDKDGNPRYQGVDTSYIVATLTAAIQETKALIDTQAETINALTARIVALENK